MRNMEMYNKYRIRVADGKFKCIEVNGDKGQRFLYPDVSDKLPKLYIIKRGNEIYYVGITTQDIRKRLRQGFSAQGEHGYHGYKWKNEDKVEVLIWCFPDSTPEHVEAIEAELVYFIREKPGKWPKYQMEIHFHGTSFREQKMAQEIFSQLLEK